MNKILFLSLLIIVGACQKDNDQPKNVNISFLASDKQVIQNQTNLIDKQVRGDLILYGVHDFRGAYLSNGILTLPYQDSSFLSKVDGSFEYNFSTRRITNNRFEKNDTNTIKDLIYYGGDKYLTLGSNSSSGIDQMIIRDKSFKQIEKDIFVGGLSDRKFYHLESLDNGNFVCVYDNFPYALNCLNRQLKSVWTINIVHNPYLITTQNSIILASLNEITQYNYSGVFSKKLKLNPNYEIHNLERTSDGIIVMGSFQQANKYDELFANLYDNNLNLIKSNIFETVNFSNDPNAKSIVRSNILVESEGYFFIVNSHSVGNTILSTEEAILIKLDKNLVTEFHKVVDSRRVAQQNSYLTRYKNELLCVGPSRWGDQSGYSFIRTDMNGNFKN